MILRRWFVQLLEGTWAHDVLTSISDLFLLLFSGVINTYTEASGGVTVDPTTGELAAGALIAGLYALGSIGLLYGLVHTILKLDGDDFMKRAKLKWTAGLWVLLSLVDYVVSGEFFVWKMAQESAEWIHTVREILFSNDMQVGVEYVAMGWLGDPFVEVGAMTVVFLLLIASFSKGFVPFSSLSIFGTLFSLTLTSYAVLPKLGIEVFPIDVTWVFIFQALFATVMGIAVSWVLGFIGRLIMNMTAREKAVSSPSLYKIVPDGLVMLAALVVFSPAEYPVIMGLLAWVSYRVFFDGDIVREIRSEQETNETMEQPEI